MKKSLFRICGIGVFVIIVLLLGACATTGSVTEADIAEVRAVAQEFCDAFGRKDLDGVMACFWDSPDLVAVPMGNAIRGYAATRAAIAQMLEQNESIRVTILESNSVPIGDAVMTLGTARFDMQPKNGPSVSFVEVWTDVMRKINGRWVMVLDHSTVLPPQ